MKKSIASLFFFGISLVSSPSLGGFTGAGSGELVTAAPDPLVVEKWKHYDGKKITQLRFHGLKRTRERSCRWLMHSSEGVPFSSFQYAVDLQTLYNTGDLYDINAVVTPDPDLSDGVIIDIAVDDKWTLLPVFGGQGGGGALTYGGGLYDSNLLGTFTTAQALVYNYNGVISYDVNFFNEFIAGTQTMASVDWSNNVNPTIIHNIDGSSAGNFSWERQQEEVMLGTHLPGLIRISFFVDTYFDSLLNSTGVTAPVFSGNQYRFHPQIFFGRVNIKDFLEEGTEFMVQPMSANPFGPVQAYQGIDVHFKKVITVLTDSNIAFHFLGGLMSLAPPPYEYQVGGYLNLRGYIDSRQIGPYTFDGTAEYRPLIWQHRFGALPGFSSFSIDKVAIQGCLFTDFGSAWGDSTLTGDAGAKQINVLWSVGLGLRFNFLHFAGAILRLDAARTLRPDEGWGLSFGVGQFF